MVDAWKPIERESEPNAKVNGEVDITDLSGCEAEKCSLRTRR